MKMLKRLSAFLEAHPAIYIYFISVFYVIGLVLVSGIFVCFITFTSLH